jgi:hypothetical protein
MHTLWTSEYAVGLLLLPVWAWLIVAVLVDWSHMQQAGSGYEYVLYPWLPTSVNHYLPYIPSAVGFILHSAFHPAKLPRSFRGFIGSTIRSAARYGIAKDFSPTKQESVPLPSRHPEQKKQPGRQA